MKGKMMYECIFCHQMIDDKEIIICCNVCSKKRPDVDIIRNQKIREVIIKKFGNSFTSDELLKELEL